MESLNSMLCLLPVSFTIYTVKRDDRLIKMPANVIINIFVFVQIKI
jgi:hypothetical protein